MRQIVAGQNELSLTVQRGHAIEGKVTDGHRGVHRAVIVARPRHTFWRKGRKWVETHTWISRTTTTDRNGRFVLRGIANVGHELEVSTEHAALATKAVFIDGPSMQVIALAPKRKPKVVVVDVDNNRVVHAVVRIYPVSDAEPILEKETDADGFLDSMPLPVDADYTLVASAPGRDLAPTIISPWRCEDTTVQLKPGRTILVRVDGPRPSDDERLVFRFDRGGQPPLPWHVQRPEGASSGTRTAQISKAPRSPMIVSLIATRYLDSQRKRIGPSDDKLTFRASPRRLLSLVVENWPRQLGHAVLGNIDTGIRQRQLIEYGRAKFWVSGDKPDLTLLVLSDTMGSVTRGVLFPRSVVRVEPLCELTGRVRLPDPNFRITVTVLTPDGILVRRPRVDIAGRFRCAVPKGAVQVVAEATRQQARYTSTVNANAPGDVSIDLDPSQD